MNKKTVLLTTLLLLLAGVTTWLTLNIVKSKTEPHENKPKNPDSFVYNAFYSEFDQKGDIHTIIRTPKLIHFPFQNSSEFQSPDITIFNDKQNPWHITAQHGTGKFGTKIINLIGAVKLHQASGPNNKELTITTAQATIYLHKKQFATDKPITIRQPGIVATATGATADLNKKVVELLSNVKEIYVPDKQQ